MNPHDGHVAVVGLGYGDEGKGTIVDWLCATRDIKAVVRFNGGAQAGHNVVTESGAHHTFSQWGSGTFQGVPTYLSRYMVINAEALLNERRHLQELGLVEPFELLHVDADALVTTPYHVAVNRAREIARGRHRHGSVGMGVGETIAFALAHPADALYVRDLRSRYTVQYKLKAIIGWSIETINELIGFTDIPMSLPLTSDYKESLYKLSGALQVYRNGYLDTVLSQGPVVFEGAQGVLLDENHGFFPYVTRSTTTFHNVRQLTDSDVYRLGVLRTFTTRHGPGPLVTEDNSIQYSRQVREPYNLAGPWQGHFRTGHFDAVAHRYAIAACDGVDGVALTHLDTVVRSQSIGIVASYEKMIDLAVPVGADDLEERARFTEELLHHRPGPIVVDIEDWPSAVSEVVGAPVVVTSSGPAAKDKLIRKEIAA